MAIPEKIISLTRDIRHKIYGRDVRESIAKGLEVSGEISDNALDVSNQTKARQDDVENRFDDQMAGNTEVDEVIDARRPEGGDAYPTLRRRLDDEHQKVTSRLFQITENINDFSHLVVNGDWTEAIKIASKNNTRVLFPRGQTFHVKSHLLIDGVKNLTWDCEGALFFDEKIDIQLSSGGQGHAPNGIRFLECENLTINHLAHDGDIEIGGEIASLNETYRLPQLDFDRCHNLTVNSAKTFGKVGAHLIDLSKGAKHFMRASYFRFSDCNGIKVFDCSIEPGSGNGEFFSFNNCVNLDFLNCRHFEGDSTSKIWSFAKIINCKNTTVDGHKVQSTSVGDLMDVAGENILIQNLLVDYPKGNLVDITAEWQESNAPEIKNVTVKDCVTTGGGVETDSLEAEKQYMPKFENIVIDNVATGAENFYIGKTNMSAKVRNVKIENIIDLNRDYYYEHDGVVVNDYSRDFTLENSEIICSGDLPYHQILTSGVTRIKNTTIKGVNFNSDIRLRDMRHLFFDTPLKDSLNKVIFEGCDFEDIEISVRSNVEFINCTFLNCRFTTRMKAQGEHSPSIRYIGCELEYKNYNKIPFDFETLHSIKFSKTEMAGGYVNVNGRSVLHGIQKVDECHVDLNDCGINLIRLNPDYTVGPTLGMMNTDVNNHTEVFMHNISFGDRVRDVIGVTGTESNSNKKVSWDLSQCITRGADYRLIRMIDSNTFKKCNLSIIRNVAAQYNLNEIRSWDLNSLDDVGNAGR